MISVSSMTLTDVIAAIEMRAGEYMTPYNSDWQTLAQYVRDARRDLFNRTNPFKEWSYVKSLNLTGPFPALLPADFIRVLRVTTKLPTDADSTGLRYEARKIDPREWMNLSKPSQIISAVSSRHGMVRGWEKTGIYMVWANGTDSDNWAMTNMALWIYPTNLHCTIEYIASYGDVTLDDLNDEVLVPIELESLLIDMAVSRFLDDVADPQQLITKAQDVAQRLVQYQTDQTNAAQYTSVSAEAIPNPEPMSIRQQPNTPGGII
jgi:hypothetical protein